MLGLDVGEQRIGLAISDLMGWTAQGLETLQRVGPRADLRALAAVAAEQGATRLVLGLPLRLDGSEGPEAQAVRELAARLEKALGLPVEFWDERLTTVQAERTLLAGGVRRARRRQERDRLAAILILQAWLDAHGGSASAG